MRLLNKRVFEYMKIKNSKPVSSSHNLLMNIRCHFYAIDNALEAEKTAPVGHRQLVYKWNPKDRGLLKFNSYYRSTLTRKVSHINLYFH